MIIKTFKLLFKSKQVKKMKFLKPKEWKDDQGDQNQNQEKDQQ